MEVVCQNCNSKVNLPAEKVPKDKSFSFTCPSCKGKVTVAPEKSAAETAARQDQAQIFSPDSTAPGAMICHTEPAVLKAIAEKLGYQIHTPGTHVEAIRNLRFNQYKLIIITEEFEKIPHDKETVMENLQEQTMDKRRGTFVAYIGSDVKSYDGMQAFAKSVNLVLSSDEFSKKGEAVGEPLKRAIYENELAYKVYFEAMEKAGKI